MGRKKTIDDATLIDLIHSYYIYEANSNPSELKLPKIAKYINRSGYKEYAVESLRRNQKARDYIDSLKRQTLEVALNTLVSYKTLDVDNFLLKHPTRSSIVQALTNLDAYYKSIADSALELNKKSKAILENYEKLAAAYQKAVQDNDKLSQSLKESEKSITRLESEKKALKSIISSYIYPEVANALLEKANILPDGYASNIIDTDNLENPIITGDTNIKSNVALGSDSKVIQGLFDKFSDI